MSDPNRENQPQDEIGLKLVRRDWTISDDQTQRMLERMLTCYGEAAAQLMSQAIWLELNLRESATTQCIERLQRQLDDTRVVETFFFKAPLYHTVQLSMKEPLQVEIPPEVPQIQPGSIPFHSLTGAHYFPILVPERTTLFDQGECTLRVSSLHGVCSSNRT